MSEDAKYPDHEYGHVWSLLTSADGVRQCLVDGCYVVRESEGGQTMSETVTVWFMRHKIHGSGYWTAERQIIDDDLALATEEGESVDDYTVEERQVPRAEYEIMAADEREFQGW